MSDTKEKSKTKKQLLTEIEQLRQVISELQAKLAENSPEKEPGSLNLDGEKWGQEIWPNYCGIKMAGLHFEWHLERGICTVDKAPFAMMWIDSTIAGLMAAFQAMVGTRRFALALQNEGRKSVEQDWDFISQYENFPEGIAAISNLAKISGWGNLELQSFDPQRQECRFRVRDSWEGRYQKALGVCWGSGLQAGKFAGYCSQLFNTNCWAEQTAFIANGDPWDEFWVQPSDRLIEEEIEQLLETEGSTQADMAVTLQKLRREIYERKRIEAALLKSEEALLVNNEKLEHRVEERTRELQQINQVLQQEIGERIGVEAALRKSQARNQAFLKAIPDLMLRMNREGIYLDAMEAKETRALIPGSELIGKNVREIFPPEFAQLTLDAIEGTLNSGEPQILEYEMPINGEMRDYEARLVASGEDEVLVIVRDITARKSFEKVLQQSEARFRAVFESTDDSILVLDTDYNYLYVNRAAGEYIGIPSEEMVGQNMRNFLAYMPDFLEFWLHRLDLVLQCGHSRHFEEKMPLGNSITYSEFTISPIKNQSGDIVAIAIVFRDISERKQAEEALLRISKAVESSSDAIAMADSTGNHFYQNRAFCQLFEYETATELNAAGGPPAVFVDSAVIQEIFSSILSGNSWRGEVTQKSKTGKLIQVLMRADAIKDTNGEIVGLIGMMTDITERKHTEAQLQQKAQQQALLYRLANQIRNSLELNAVLQIAVTEIRQLLQIDRCHFVWFRVTANPPHAAVVTEDKNPAFPDYTGLYPLEQIKPFADKFLNLKSIRVDDVTTLSDSGMRHFLLQMGFASLLAIPLQTQRGEIGVVTCGHHQDIRPWQDSEVALLQAVLDQLAIAINQADLYAQTRMAAAEAQAKAQELERTLQELKMTQTHLIQTEKLSSLGQLVAGVAHEINNPVNFIYGNLTHAKTYTSDLMRLLHLYLHEYPNPTPTLREEIEALELDFLMEDFPKLLDSIQVGAQRIRDIVLSLRNFSRLDEAQMKEVDIHEGIDNTLMILQNRLKAKPDHPGIKIIKEYGNLPLIECYPGQLNQVFMNILNNAIDALDDCGYKPSLTSIPSHLSTITIRTEIRQYGPVTPNQNRAVPGANSQSVRITIADNGPGIPDAVRLRIFDPFFTTKPVGKGTGLGLAISHSIVVEKHQGILECHSTPGEGTQFIIQIPLHQ